MSKDVVTEWILKSDLVYRTNYGPNQIGALVIIWTELLSGKSDQQIEAAFTNHLATGKYFPVPADILAHIGPSGTRKFTQEELAEVDETVERLKAGVGRDADTSPEAVQGV